MPEVIVIKKENLKYLVPSKNKYGSNIIEKGFK